MGADGVAALVAEQLRLAGAVVVAEVREADVARASGWNRVSRVALADGREVACDAVVAATGRAPRVELLQQADCRVAFDAERGVVVPVLADDSGATTTPRVFAAGACAGSRSAAESVAAGERAGKAAARSAEGGR